MNIRTEPLRAPSNRGDAARVDGLARRLTFRRATITLVGLALLGVPLLTSPKSAQAFGGPPPPACICGANGYEECLGGELYYVSDCYQSNNNAFCGTSTEDEGVPCGYARKRPDGGLSNRADGG
jgi:hypothetical protein